MLDHDFECPCSKCHYYSRWDDFVLFSKVILLIPFILLVLLLEPILPD